MARADIDDLRERTRILAERTKGGLANHFDLERQHIDLRFAEAQLPALEAQEASQINRIALLLGDRPGSLSDLLHPQESEAAGALPDLALGLPSTVALRRPDIRAAEARLHEATAKIGVARADLYPAIKLGGNFDLESYRASNLFEWGSHSWGIGPSVDLPLFDGARRRRTIRLRELEQKEAAVSFEQTVLRAWQEIDDALNAYQAERVENAKLAERREARDRRSTLPRPAMAAGSSPGSTCSTRDALSSGPPGKLGQRCPARHALCRGQQGHRQCSGRTGENRLELRSHPFREACQIGMAGAISSSIPAPSDVRWCRFSGQVAKLSLT
jgi:outer membrane protein TolC